MEGHESLYIYLYFHFIDSKLFKEWDPRGYKLYHYMRRHIWRRNSGKLGGYYQQGWLAVEGYLGTWATWLGVSKPQVSELLAWMEERKLIRCLYKTKTNNRPNIYALGQVVNVIGGTVAEFIYQDYFEDEPTEDMQPKDTEPILAYEVPEPPPITESRMLVPKRPSVHTREQGVHTRERSNKISNNNLIGDELLLSCSNEHDNTLSEYSEATPSSEGTSSDLAAIPSLELDSANLNSAAISRRIEAGAKPKASAARRRADAGAVAFSTPGAAYMVELYAKEGAALHRSPPGKFPSLTAKERFEAIEAKLGLEAFKKALIGCFTSRGYPSIAQVIGYVERVETNGNGNGQSNTPAKSTLPPLLFQKVAEAIRYNSEAQEHIPRISRLTETCQQRGYTEEQIRKAGKLWWETWPGNTGKGPNDAEFLQKIEIVKKERV